MTVPSEQCINYFVVKKRTQQSARRVGSKKPATNGKGVTKKRLREVIPKTFSNNLRKKLPQSATLKGPSGLTWDVELTTNDDATFFNHIWQKFVKDHSLEETNLLNLCGKGASYFVKKCGQTEHDNRCLTKKRLKEGSMDDVHTPLDVDARCTSPVNSMGDDSAFRTMTQQSARRVGSKKPATNGEGVTKKRLREGSMDDVHTQLDVDAGCTSPVNSMGDDSVIVPSE
ncbi:b3 domain-containing protein rem16 [Quercus suber]|uniref:B3 domain-containing protein rem16 n=1 Tax=Quercus suber TaxID=58331 RepID=A0AAW0JGK1_QUESU